MNGMIKFAILDHVREKDLEIALLRKRNRRLQCEDNRLYYHRNRSEIIDDACRKELYQASFQQATLVIEHLTGGYSAEEQLDLLRSFRKIVSMDLSYSKIAMFVYQNKQTSPGTCFPFYYYSASGKRVDLGWRKQIITIKDKYVIEIPYSSEKWLRHLSRKQDLDVKEYKESLPYYYAELNMVVQGGGCIHRTAEAFVNRRNGTAMVRQYDTNALYENITTDGANWINIHNGQIIGPVGDYRFALVYWLKQRELSLRVD